MSEMAEERDERGPNDIEVEQCSREKRQCTREKGIPRRCGCGGAMLTLTSRSPDHRGYSYFDCLYDEPDGPSQGCRFKKWWEEAVLEELAEAKKENHDMELAFNIQAYEAVKKFVALQSKFEELHTKFEALELELKYEKLNCYM